EQERRREHERQQVEQQQREHGDESVHEQQEAERREHERKMQQQRAEEEGGQQQKPTPTTCAAAGEEACNVFVSGTLPDIAPGAEVQFPDYEEEYRREKPGVVRSYTGMDIILREGGETKTIRMTVDQLIQFDECPHRTFDKDNNVVLHVKRVHVTYDVSEGIVRYGSRNYAKPGSVSSTNREQIQPAQHSHFDRRQHGQAQQQAQNPVELNRDLCAEGRHVCTLPNMRCRPVDPSYRCECLPGYQAKRNESSPLGWNCQAFHGDETSMESGFTTMDAIELTLPRGEPEQQLQSQHPKGTCTNHQQCHQWGECAFVDGSPHGQCKCRGWYVGDGVDHCGPPQEQRHEEPRLNANIPMRGGQPCGQHVCDVNAECMPSPSGGSECVCKAGYHGNGISCESLSDDEEEVKTQVPQETVGKVCRAHEECSEHGSCSYSRTLGYYHCTCTKPYVGNGVECTLKHEGAQEREEQQGCDRLRNCDQNAQCVYDSHNRIYRCECYEGYAGDGKTCVQIHTGRQQWEGGEKQPQQCRDSTDCHQNGHCVVAGTQGYICECLPGYRGDGVRQCAVADQCNPTDRSSCHQNAECVYGEAERAYVCKCVRGFTGDGVRCVPHARPQTCREEPRLCHANAQCVYNHNENTFICVCKPGAVGDGYQKCDIQDDQHAGAFVFVSYAGKILNRIKTTEFTASCLDDRSLCDPHAECVPGEGGHYVCNCLYGYRGNGRTCTRKYQFIILLRLTSDSQPRDETLLVSRGMAIFQRGVNPETPGKQLIVIPHHIAVGLDYDCKEDRIIWSDISGHSIRSASLNGTDHKSFYAADLNSPEGVAVDWSSRNVYYADSLKDEIGVASLDGKYQKALVTEGLVNPRALALDLHNRHLYYTDWHRENPVIGRVDMDGQNNRIFLNDDIHLPNGIAILPNRRELCWVDAGNHRKSQVFDGNGAEEGLTRGETFFSTNRAPKLSAASSAHVIAPQVKSFRPNFSDERLSCIGLDGNNRRVVFAPLQHPFGLTHNNEARFYWTDWKEYVLAYFSNNRIHSVGIYGDGYASFPISLGGSGKVYGILSVPKHCTGPNTACSVNNGGCPYLCLPGQEEVRCECPSNVAVKGC
ncbi:EGF-like domain protein, partial [Necator americanus]